MQKRSGFPRYASIAAGCLIIFPILLTGCSSAKKVAVKPLEHMEVGWTPRSVFQSPAYAIWFDSTYAAYEPNSALIQRLERMKDSVELVVIYGIWCSDSKREIPRFLKIGDAVKFPAVQMTMIAVDRTMEIPTGIKKEYAITNVPTFIVKYRGIELGRIIESPRVSLEQDLADLLGPVFEQ